MNEPSIPVAIDSRVWLEVGSFFPLDGHHKTKASNAECRRITVLLIWTALKDSNCQFSFSQRVMDCMSLVGSKKRQRIVEYFSQSKFFEVAQNYSAGRNSIIWKLSKAQVKRASAHEHNECDVEADAYWRTRWRYAGVVVTVNLSLEWLHEYDRSFRRACSILFPDKWAFVPLIESSIAQLVIGTVSYGDCLDAAKRSRSLSETTPEAKAAMYQESWGSFQERPLSYLTRVSGRCYHPLTNQSKTLRRQHLQLQHNGLIEKTLEIDMSSTYWVLLTSMLDDSRCKDSLIRDLTEGCFYQKLYEASENTFTDSQSLKAAVNKDCLFGKQDFGKTLLFSAMQKLFPDLARFIRHKRLHHDVSWLSDVLTNAESAFFIDLLLPVVVNAGIPSLPIHDALLIPASRASQVEGYCRQLAVQHFGWCPRFKTQL